MRPERWKEIQRAFHACRELGPDERGPVLDRLVGDDAELRREVEELLGEASSWFPEDPPLSAGEDDLGGLALGDYQLGRRIGSGSSGVVYEARQSGLGRTVAVKVLRTRSEVLAGGGSSQAYEHLSARFVEEAEILGRLDHPGIVPVHEVRNAEGRRFFTMRLVRGRDLASLVALAHGGDEEWSLLRLLALLVRVCETVAFAHARGVIHRDLKPSHVMVGLYGEVYIVDWGLARLLDRAETKDIRIREVAPSDAAGDDLQTVDGVALGTPAYMPPEQAGGRLERIDERADVFSLGAMLYHVLSGRVPYAARDGRPRPAHETLERVRAGPPPPLREVAPATPPELVAICEKATARGVEARYASVEELADDLSSYLENRVVRAYRTGPWAELSKWFVRNRRVAVTLAVSLFFLVTVSAGASLVLADRNDALVEARDQAREREDLAQRRSEEILRLADLRAARRLREEVDHLWPLGPGLVADLEVWLVEARELVARLPGHRATKARLAERGRALRDDELSDLRASHPDRALRERLRAELAAREAELAWVGRAVPEHNPLASAPFTEFVEVPRKPMMEKFLGRRPELLRGRIAELEAQLAAAPALAFERPGDGWWHATLVDLVDELEALEGDGGWIEAVEERLAAARAAVEESVGGDDAVARWAEAAGAVAGSPHYGGLVLAPQPGLVPLGPDPASGLWEFAHLGSGDAAARDAGTARLAPTAESGLVLVLLPGGSFRMGAQARDPEAPHYHPDARWDEDPVQEVALEPFFLAKYEVTQAQWARAGEANPSAYAPDFRGALTIDGRHPVETVSWYDARRVAARWGLALPTEAQWEYAARGGTSTTWWTGDDRQSLVGALNIADRALFDAIGEGDLRPHDWPELRDGAPVHAPVGSYRANPFGLHDMLGNVSEWVRDSSADYLLPVRAGDGLRLPTGGTQRLARGSSHSDTTFQARSAYRLQAEPETRASFLGVRFSRPLER